MGWLLRASTSLRVDGQDNSGERPVVLVVGPFSACGGIGAVCRHMCTGELPRRWRVVAFDNTKTTPASRSLPAAVAVHLMLLLRLIGAIIRHRPALVHLHTCSYWTFCRSMPDILIARLLLCPVVLHIHGGYFHEFLSDLGGLPRRLVVAHLRMARRIIVLGEVWRERLASTVPPERIHVVPNGVPIPERCRTARRGKRVRIVCVGDLSAGKAPEDLIEAVARLSPVLRGQVRVAFIGPPPTDSPARRLLLERVIARKGLEGNVRLLGPLAPERAQARVRRADVHVLPSRGEGLPMALLEAMAWGLPSIVTRVGAIPEVVTDGVEAFVIEPGDVEALTERLTQLLSDARLRATMGRSARERASAVYHLGRFHAGLDRVWLGALGSEAALLASTPPAS